MLAGNVAMLESPTQPTVRVWIEDGTGAIARGTAQSVSVDGTRVILSEPPGFAAQDEVALRICFAPGTPTVATTARVIAVRTAGRELFECSLAWTAPAHERAALDAWLASS